MRKILFLLCHIGISCALWAQTDQALWTNLRNLHAGQKIQVVGINSKKHSGRFLSVSDATISYKDSTGEQTIQKQDVRGVKLMENRHRLRNTFVVGGVGAALGVEYLQRHFNHALRSSPAPNLEAEVRMPQPGRSLVCLWRSCRSFIAHPRNDLQGEFPLAPSNNNLPQALQIAEEER